LTALIIFSEDYTYTKIKVPKIGVELRGNMDRMEHGYSVGVNNIYIKL